MFCINCGKELPPNAKFCPNCGTPVFADNSKDEGKKASTGIENGHKWVDLGLSVKWATCNIGANSVEEEGALFRWGEVAPKPDDNTYWSGYRFLSESRSFIDPYTISWRNNADLKEEMEAYVSTNLTKYTNSDGITQLDISDDAARVNWGSRWRMPSEAEFGELRAKCMWIWTKQGGVNGYRITGPNGNSIFLCGAHARCRTWSGFWSSNLVKTDPVCAKSLELQESKFGIRDNAPRCYGFLIRPVIE